MKKILILTTVSGFLYQFELDNVKILQNMGYEVHYAANGELPRYLFEQEVVETSGVIFHHVGIEKSPAKCRKNAKAFREIMQIIRQEQIQVLHCHTPMGGVLGRLAGKRCEAEGISLKVIYTAHGFHFYQGAPRFAALVYRMAEAYLAHYTDRLVTINREDYENARTFRLREQGAVYQIPGVGLDMEYYHPANKEQRQNARKSLQVAENQMFLLSVGELNENKNHRVMIEALREMQKQGRDISDLKYGICGDGDLREALHQLVREYQLEQNVIFYGYQKDVRPYLWAADLFVFPSRREGLGMAALEALAAGVPVLAADNRGSREYMQHGKNGFLCIWDDKDAYIRALEQMQNQRPEEWHKIQKFCRESVEKFQKKYTHEIMKQVYESLS